MDTVNEILDAIEILSDKKISENITKVLTGICTSVNINKNTCVMNSNGVSGTVYFYGSPPKVNEIYRIFVPSNDMSRAFVIVPPEFTVNPNLLDNWYFGRPVDQRGGYISLQGVPVYSDAACTSLIGNQIETAATCIKSGTNYERRINGQGGGFVKAADVVRGYTGNVYGVDRWKLYQSTVSVTVRDDGLGIRRSSGDYYTIAQYVDNSQDLAGKTVTFSALVTAAPGTYRLCILAGRSTQTIIGSVNGNAGETGIKSVSVTLPDDVSDLWVSVYTGTTASDYVVAAIKLELGSNQTLAHRENGNWVLNEVPDYGEQLRRCQRYFVRFGSASVYTSIGMGQARTTTDIVYNVPIPANMRAVPIVSVIGNVVFRNSVNAYIATTVGIEAISPSSVLLVSGVATPTAGLAYDVYLEMNSYITLNANL